MLYFILFKVSILIFVFLIENVLIFYCDHDCIIENVFCKLNILRNLYSLQTFKKCSAVPVERKSQQNNTTLSDN